ncbi:DUF6286 domain-containing protein [Thermomonospora cellulosilytica]|uniref:DUF6286 domain-containing protein n=1 Tax=Thermomonospora cellulosilytica TaxID=1411118 RepID=A0A7W3N4Y1_9ACTN|nr:DUF6286 domain-containing protein [Thermomonospora cellulosilytica]MBA9007628.1 hypothetical protein [Thermomonospora cellulosilytica]
MTTHAGQLRPARPRPARGAVDRTARRAAHRVFRPRRMWPALLVSALLTVVGVVVATEVIAALAGASAGLIDHDRITSWLSRTSWNDAVTIAAASVAALLGLACLAAGLNPGHTSLVELHSDDPDLVVGVMPRGLRHAVAAAAGDVEAVTAVRKVRLRRHRVRVVVETALRDPAGLDERVAEAVAGRLERLGTRPARKVSVRVRTTEAV